MSSEHKKAASARRARLLKSANVTLMTCLAVTALWLYVYNIVVNRMNPVLAFFKILDGVNELVVGMLTVVAIGLGIVFLGIVFVAGRDAGSKLNKAESLGIPVVDEAQLQQWIQS